jgi:hypothetical protein
MSDPLCNDVASQNRGFVRNPVLQVADTQHKTPRPLLPGLSPETLSFAVDLFHSGRTQPWRGNDRKPVQARRGDANALHLSRSPVWRRLYAARVEGSFRQAEFVNLLAVTGGIPERKDRAHHAPIEFHPEVPKQNEMQNP